MWRSSDAASLFPSCPMILRTSLVSTVASWAFTALGTLSPQDFQSRSGNVACRSREVMGTTKMSRGSGPSPTTIAGRTLWLVGSEKGIGSRTTSFREQFIVDVVFPVIPDARQVFGRGIQPFRPDLVRLANKAGSALETIERLLIEGSAVAKGALFECAVQLGRHVFQCQRWHNASITVAKIMSNWRLNAPRPFRRRVRCWNGPAAR